VEKYPDAEVKIQVLRAKGVQVFFGIDATKFEKHTVLKGRKWDRVVWNFPHAGSVCSRWHPTIAYCF
jgi:25S rRNA (uracil2634-N3)-methyltransferase